MSAMLELNGLRSSGELLSLHSSRNESSRNESSRSGSSSKPDQSLEFIELLLSPADASASAALTSALSSSAVLTSAELTSVELESAERPSDREEKEFPLWAIPTSNPGYPEPIVVWHTEGEQVNFQPPSLPLSVPCSPTNLLVAASPAPFDALQSQPEAKAIVGEQIATLAELLERVSSATSTNEPASQGTGTEGASANESQRGTQSLTPAQEHRVVQRVLQSMESLGDAGGMMKVRLHPQELGSLHLSLRTEAGQVFAVFEVENSAAKEALLQNANVLRERLHRMGMEIKQFDVFVTNAGASNQNMAGFHGSASGERHRTRENRYLAIHANRRAPTELSGVVGVPVWFRNGNNLDLTI